LGKSAFDALLEQEGAAAGLASVGSAISGGHLRFVSLDEDEQTALAAAGASGSLETSHDDLVFASVQNLGADKLDFHAVRTVEHSCDVSDGETATCLTKMTLENAAPTGLPHYVAPNRPYAEMRSFAELYVPGAAEVTGVFLDDESTDHLEGRQDGLLAVGKEVEVPRGEQRSLSVAYELPLEDGVYSLEVLPQPLARDAQLMVGFRVDADQVVRGPGSLEDGLFTFKGPLDGGSRFQVGRDERSGLAGLWKRLGRFWNEPVF
jgi:hypothetical protein